MRVSTRIIIGFAILLLVANVVLAYQVSSIYYMQSINRDLSVVSFDAARIIQEMDHQLGEVESFARKYFVLGGEEFYERELAVLQREIGEDLGRLQEKSQTPRELEAIRALAQSWTDFWARWEVEKLRIDPAAEDPDSPASLQEALENIRGQTEATWYAIQSSIQEQVIRAAAAGNRARTVSFIAGGASLLISIIVGILLVRAISDPLRQLTQGTRRISKGQFWHRLPADGRDEFAELARDFNAMAERLSVLDQMKKDFVSHVSHELKAPLASMRQVFLLLLQQIAGPLNDQQRKLLRLSSSSAERLTAMVGNLLDVSRLEAGTMEYDIHPYDVASLVRTVAEEFQVQTQEKSMVLAVQSDGDAWAECDRDRIVQVIGNLFENALKFAPPESEITAKIQHTDQQKLLISVSDSGPGVPDGHKLRVFEKFHQVKQGRKIAGQGVGLGLAICKTIVEAHNGSIWVEDNPAGGSIFCFMLRAAAVPASSGVNDAASAVGQSR